jgi:hypothetical protein
MIREMLWKQLPFPDTYLCIVVSDKILAYVTSNLKKIESVHHLKQVMVSGGLNTQLSLLNGDMLQAMFKVIENELSITYPPVPILSKPPVRAQSAMNVTQTQPQSAMNREQYRHTIGRQM